MKMISINNRRYIGSKYKMINFIKETMSKEKIEYSSFLDLFGGTGIVGDFFNDQKTKVYVNDLLKSNYISYLAWFGNEKIDKIVVSIKTNAIIFLFLIITLLILILLCVQLC